jgi:hypothetical protein
MRTRVITRLIGGVMLIFAMAVMAAAQESSQQDPPEKAKPKTDSEPRGARSLLEDAFGNMRHRFGFSVGAFGFYQSNLYVTSVNKQNTWVASINPGIYANFGGRKSQLHLNYGAGYQIYRGKVGLNELEHGGNAGYSYQLSRNASLNVSDRISSSPNGYGNFLFSALNPSFSAPSLLPELLVGRQRITRNNLDTRLAFGIGKNRFGVFGGYTLYRFKESPDRNFDGFFVGGSYDRKLTRWLYFSNRYSTYLSGGDPLLRGIRIHQLRVGGLNFKLGTAWELGFGGGVSLADTAGHYLLRENVSVSLAGTSTSHVFTLGYHRGFFSTVGVPGVFQSDLVNTSLGSRLTTRLNLQLSALYMRGFNYYVGKRTGGTLDYYTARGGLEFSLFQGLVSSAGFIYTDQRARDISGLPISMNRYAVYAGLQFVFPSGNR